MPWPHRKSKFRRRRDPHPVPDLLFGQQGRHQLLYHGACERGQALRHSGLLCPAGRYPHGFTAAREKNPEGDDVYGGRIARSVAGMERDEQNGMPRKRRGAFIAHVADKKSVRPINTIGLQYKFFCFLVKILPAKTLNWLVGLIYAK